MVKGLDKIERMLLDTWQEQGIPGMAVNLVSKGEVIYSRGFGKLNRTSELDVTPDTIFSIKSITKSFTASALVHLHETTDFDLNKLVKEYLPYFKTKDGQEDKITTKHILSHTAGFPDNLWVATLLDQYMFEMGKGVPAFQFIFEQIPEIDSIIARIKSRADLTKYFSNIALSYEPGEGWTYSTDAYVIAADVLEKVSGKTWEEYLKTYILEPLQLTRTFVDSSFMTEQPNVATYLANFGGHLVDLPIPQNKIAAPVGFIYSTANDLSKYLMSHMSREDSFVLASGLARTKERIAKREAGLSYGLGWKIKSYHGLEVVEHAGGYPGISCIATMVPEDQFGLVILSNTDLTPVQQMADTIVDLFYEFDGAVLKSS